jgi:TonB-dependent receptor
MLKPLGAISLLLLTSALVAPSMAMAQNAEPEQAEVTEPQTPDQAVSASENAEGQADQADEAAAPAEEEVDVSIPGGEEIVVRGYLDRNISKNAPQVVSVLSSADIERTGEGDIAGALSRVTGLSVVGGGFVYVRGLGDRYSLALLNGSPLPSPEPLKRVVPLDLFPTSVIASSLVQKTYSANFPGEFGGGVINLTTKAIPRETFLTISGDIGVNSEATNQLGYTYYGSSSDWTGFDNGNRDLKPALAAFLAGSNSLNGGNVDTGAIARELVTGRNAVVQRNRNLPPNGSANITGGTNFEIGDDATMGLLFNAGYSNKWRTRDTIQQTASTVDLSELDNDFQRVITDNRIVVNALAGFGIEAGEQKLRWTNVFIRDTLKQARIGLGSKQENPAATYLQQDTAWYERQLVNSQFVGEFKLSPDVNLSTRVAYANSKREAPDEFSFEYFRSNLTSDPFGDFFINELNNGQSGNANVTYSYLNEDLWSGGLDLSVKITPDISATIGYAYSETTRRVERRSFLFTAPSTFPTAVALLRPDFLLQPDVIDFYDIELIDTDPLNPIFDARLLTNAGYGQVQAFLTPELSLNVGVRYEAAKQSVETVQAFSDQPISNATTQLSNAYWLPAATLTWDINDQMKFRVSGSKTIARPQFRELIFQSFYDPDSNRSYRGNPFLTDSQLYNAEARYEWYFDRDQRVTLAGFFKRIDNPIEAFLITNQTGFITSFANAPKADLYGAELETQKYFDLSGLTEGGFFSTRRAVVIANYTYTKSDISVAEGDSVAVFAASSTRALDFFTDGSPLTGQSDHLVNLQFGLEDTERLSQQTILLSYASERVTSRGGSGQPDVKERPGFQLDFVAREGFTVWGKEAELKFEVRNLTDTKYQEFQESGENIVFYNRYDQGISASLGVEINF